MDPRLNHVIAAALRNAIVPVQTVAGRPVIIRCAWCEKNSNPRADLETALRDLSGHLPTHPEYIDTLVTAWIDVSTDGMTATALEHEVAGRSEESREVFREMARIRRDARTDLAAALDNHADALTPAERGA